MSYYDLHVTIAITITVPTMAIDCAFEYNLDNYCFA